MKIKMIDLKKFVKNYVKNYEFMRIIMSSISKHRGFSREMIPDDVTTQLIVDDLKNYPLGGYEVMSQKELEMERKALLQFMVDYEESSERYPGYFKHIIDEFKKIQQQ